ncbi:MAG: hypothetical protein ABSB15_01240 [Bryobacteraceae bacterium]|jgi:anti-sigma28 factor (negative regulator of flagellin synthesis)
MPFRVNNNNATNAALGPASRTAETESVSPAAKAAEAPPAAAADGLQLSKSADTLSRISQSDAANRSQRVLQLAATVSGSYQVEPAAVSRAIVEYAISAGQTSVGDEHQ